MGIMDELKRLAHPYEDDDLEDDYEDEEFEEELEPEAAQPAPRATHSERSSQRTGSFGGGSMSGSSSAKNPNVVSINPRAQVQVVLVKPEKYSNASEVADHLLANRTIVLNLEKTDNSVSRRLLDFLSGVAYSNHGKIQRVASSTYIITPANVQFQGELKDEMESNGMLK